jgi:predicted transcriptional regulator
MSWEDIGFIKASQYRLRILSLLSDGPKTPRELVDSLKIHFSQVSLILNQLSERKMVECLNPEAVKGKLYHLTEKGKNILAKA